MKIPANIRDLYTRYIETVAEVKRLEQDQKAMKAAIVQHMGSKKEIVECGFAVKLTPGVRKTPNACLIEEALGVKLTNACFTTTSYDSLHVTPLKT